MKSLLFLAALVSVGAGWQLRQAEEGQDPLAMFIAIDMDGSRTISAPEMKAFFTENMPEHVKGVDMMIATFDSNGDGEINLQEAVAMNEGKEEDDIKARYMFNKIADMDGSGAVTKEEYHTVMMCLGMGPDLSEKYMNEDFAKYDTNGDGQMNFEEFKAHMSQPKDEEKKRNWFRALDKDGDGEITMAEQRMTWENMGAHEMANIEMIKDWTAKWDANKNGMFSFDEFQQQP